MKRTGSRSKVFLLISALFMLAAPARAAVVINEVMYNPEGSDSGREWVELYNDGAEDVTLVGGSGSGSWRIADSSNHTLVAPPGNGGRGSLVVPAGGYLVIASDPATFIGEYGGSYSVVRSALSLNNTGATVSLVNGSGSTVSTFTYAPDAGGSDDGNSLQLNAGIILHALPTPGAQNATQSYEPPAGTGGGTDNTGNNTVTQVASPSYVSAPLPQVFPDAGEDRTVIVGADTQFVALAYDRNKSVIKYAKFMWTFGDGTTEHGPVVMHHFSYPGRYAVGLTVTNDSFRRSDRITVVAEPASIGLGLLPRGGAAIKNLSGRDLDLSFWKVVDDKSEFILPEHTVVLKESAINISAATLGFEARSGTQLFYPDGTKVELTPEATSTPVAAKAETAPAPSSPNAGVGTASVPVKKKPASPKQPVPAAEPVVVPAEPEATSTEPVVVDKPLLVAAAAEARLPVLPQHVAWGGLGGLIGLGIAGILHIQKLRALRPKEETPLTADEFTIE